MEGDVALKVPVRTRVKLRVVFNAKFEFSDHFYHRIVVAEVFPQILKIFTEFS